MGVLIMLWWQRPNVLIHNILISFGLAGSASFFGLSLSSSVVVFLLMIFSVYDFIAVYKTRHMIAMAKEMVEKKVILGLILPKDKKLFLKGLSKIKVGQDFILL